MLIPGFLPLLSSSWDKYFWRFKTHSWLSERSLSMEFSSQSNFLSSMTQKPAFFQQLQMFFLFHQLLATLPHASFTFTALKKSSTLFLMFTGIKFTNHFMLYPLKHLIISIPRSCKIDNWSTVGREKKILTLCSFRNEAWTHNYWPKKGRFFLFFISLCNFCNYSKHNLEFIQAFLLALYFMGTLFMFLKHFRFNEWPITRVLVLHVPVLFAHRRRVSICFDYFHP